MGESDDTTTTRAAPTTTLPTTTTAAPDAATTTTTATTTTAESPPITAPAPAEPEDESEGVVAVEPSESIEGPRYGVSPVTRGEMAALLVRGLRLDGSLPYSGLYPDVPEGAWYTPHVEVLGAYGLADTQVSDLYRPGDPALRSEMAVFLQRAFRLHPEAEMRTSSFADVGVDDPYAEAAESLLEAGITRGCGVDALRFCPDGMVTRDAMAAYLARYFRYSGLREVLAFAPDREILQTISVGEDVWDVWVCDDAPVREDLVTYLNREIGSYYQWLSGGRHQMSFRYGTDPPPGVVAVLDRCESADHVRHGPAGANVFIGGDLWKIGVGIVGLTSSGFDPESRRFTRNVWMDKRAMYDTTGYAHEIGHTFNWPHNHRDRSSPASEPLHTRMDIMASLGQVIGTNAHNLFQTGWIDPDRVRVHPGGTATYAIAPPHEGAGLELLLLALGEDRLISVGARVKEGFDRNIRAEGVELYDIEFCGEPPGCKNVYLPPGARSDAGVVLGVGDSWTGEIPTLRHGIKSTIEYEVSVRGRQDRVFEVTVEETPVSEVVSTVDGFSAIGVGRPGVCGITAGGGVHCWDWRGGPSIPTGVFTSVNVGHRACGIRIDGNIECWGKDSDGSHPPEGEFATVDVHGYHGCAIRTSGMVECWGSNQSRPIGHPPDGEFASVSAGWDHACGVRPDMSVECWGQDSAGQASPPAGDFVWVGAGRLFSCGLRPDASLACWGSDISGQSSPPTGEFSHVGAGRDHACAIRTDGSVACWGSNEYGEATPPQGVFTTLSVGDARTCGLRINGAFECWGRKR